MSQRILREIKDIKQDKATDADCVPFGEDCQHLICSISGPKDSPYENGVFLLDFKYDDDHPFKPPKVKFITKVYHPNISSQTGAICLNTLREDWSPSNLLSHVLLSIQSLLDSPEPDDPQDAVVAEHYKKSYKGFETIARRWTANHANVTLKQYALKNLQK